MGRREGHDATDFYRRFQPKEISADDNIKGPFELSEPLICGDSRHMDALPDSSVALVVTSPPYFAGKAYEQALGQGVIPATYADYLLMLHDVFAECVRVLEPGGRIAVNVANLGRKPYRSLASDVIRILDDDLGLLLRGEVIWSKADGASGSCAWGSYRSPTNPVLRDTTERVIIASKGRFDRAVSIGDRAAGGYPYKATINTDEFLDATLDLWRIPPESARRVGHPAPFPVELPQRLIDLYTFENDLVLDPFLGSGTTAVAARRTKRRYVGYDTDSEYVALARQRLEAQGIPAEIVASSPDGCITAPDPSNDADFQSRSSEEGKAAQALAADILTDAGFDVERRNDKVPGLGITLSLVATDRLDEPWYFDVTGAFTSTRGGLIRTDTLWKCLGRASVLATRPNLRPLILLTSHLPPRRSTGDHALRAVGPSKIHDAIAMLEGDGMARLAAYAAGGHRQRPLPGFWSEAEMNKPG